MTLNHFCLKFAKPDHRLHCPPEDNVGHKLSIECTVKTDSRDDLSLHQMHMPMWFCLNLTLVMLDPDTSCSENTLDPDQLASQKLADQDPHVFPLCL